MNEQELSLSNEQLEKITVNAINELIKSDDNLSDLPQDPTLDEVNAHIAATYGQSMTIFIVKGDGEQISVIIKQDSSRVSDLKRAIQQHMTLKMRRAGENMKINWKHLWRTYNLSFNGIRLQDDKEFLHTYGISNKSRLDFAKNMKYHAKLELE